MITTEFHQYNEFFFFSSRMRSYRRSILCSNVGRAGNISQCVPFLFNYDLILAVIALFSADTDSV